MPFYADLHIHSKYSRATSRDCDLENLAYWGAKKGIAVIGTGDFTHPAWIAEIKQKLVPAEPGLFRLTPDLEKAVLARLPKACQKIVRFMLSVEISTIYKKGDKTRKVHHLVYAPDIEKAETLNRALEKIGNIRSDGRPILGLDSRNLLEIVLQASPECYVVPAHIWTPWFSVLGSKSGFDKVSDCYGDLANHIFAVETGLSSDPEMNWRISHLDRYRLISNSDAHSPAKLGREVCVFDTNLDYHAMRLALENGKGYGGTLEFFPEEGKYHMDGHRQCGVRFHPEESRAHNGLCPVCKKPLTLGVLYRVEELADRPAAGKPADAAGFQSVIPLPEMLGEIQDSGPASKGVLQNYEGLLSKLGAELGILAEIPLNEIEKESSSLVAEAVSRMRSGKVLREAGYDGEYGRIKLFEKEELKNRAAAGVLFPSDSNPGQTAPKKSLQKKVASKEKSSPAARPKLRAPAMSAALPPAETRGLDPDQARALEITNKPLLIIAGPGSGKTRTLTHRIAHLIESGLAPPEECLALTFTRRAAAEMQERLARLLGENAKRICVTTFHGLGWKMLSEMREAAGLPRGFRVAGDQERAALLKEKMGLRANATLKILRGISNFKRVGEKDKPEGPEAARALKILEAQKDREGWLGFEDLLLMPARLLEADPGLREHYRQVFRWISIDEYQDIDVLQYRLIKLLSGNGQRLSAIGDPDQAIYSFRGADVGFFLRFEEDFPGAKKILLTRNYRSGGSILEASSQMIAPATLVEERRMEALLQDPGRVVIHEAPSERAEAEFIVHSIEKMIGGISFFSLDSERADGAMEEARSFSDFAVLYRTEAQAGALEEAFLRSGIPFQRRTPARLGEHPLVQAFLKTLETVSPHETLGVRIADAHNKLSKNQADGPEQAAIFTKLGHLAERAQGSYEDFLSLIHLGDDMEIWDPRAERVSLLTLHAAKGLEFPVVFIAGCEEGLLPLFWGGSCDEKNLAEERRIFYVGMTRAKARLFLSNARKRLRHGKINAQTASRFLKDIEARLFEKSRSAFRNSPQSPQLELL